MPKGKVAYRQDIFAKMKGAAMSALNIKKGSTSHSAYELRDPNGELIVSHTLAVIVENEPGVLARVIGLFSGRGYNIQPDRGRG